MITTREQLNLSFRLKRAKLAPPVEETCFLLYQANWSDAPMLNMTSRRYTERTNHATNVKIYTNAKQVELLLNGKPCGQSGTATDCAFIWNNVPLSSGENRITAEARRANKICTTNVFGMLLNELQSNKSLVVARPINSSPLL